MTDGRAWPCRRCSPATTTRTTIGGLVDDVHAALEPLTTELEVIVVNDGSSDGSREVLDSMLAATGRGCGSSTTTATAATAAR